MVKDFMKTGGQNGLIQLPNKLLAFGPPVRIVRFE